MKFFCKYPNGKEGVVLCSGLCGNIQECHPLKTGNFFDTTRSTTQMNDTLKWLTSLITPLLDDIYP
jgi:hypothetical protein